MNTPNIIGISGSLRAGSFNTALIRAAIELAPPGTTIEEGTIRGIPLYDGDVEATTGTPSAAATLKDQIASSSGILIATPEYNHSIPGVLKNAIDWLSRPPSDHARVFAKRPVAIIGATTGPGGTAMGQAAWHPVFRALRVRPYWGPQILVGKAATVFDDDGKLVDDSVREQLEAFVAGYAEFIAAGDAA